MSSEAAALHADADVVQAWITGWALVRETSLPVAVAGGYRVDVGWPQQRVRYVFPRCCDELEQLAESIVEPWILLKACAGPEELQRLLPPRWMIQRVGYMMTRSPQSTAAPARIPDGYMLEVMKDLAVSVARVVTTDGDVASIGRVALAGDFAIYDRIETAPSHRRRGLASAVMNALAAVAEARVACWLPRRTGVRSMKISVGSCTRYIRPPSFRG